MKHILFTLAVCLILCMTFSGIVLASDISDAAYYGVIIVTDNGTAATGVSTNISGLSTTEMIAQGWLNSSANNCAMRNSSGADVAFMPGNNSTNPWMMFVDSINAYSQKNYTLYTDSATGGSLAVFATSTNVTDSANMKPSANFTAEYNGYVGDTSTAANIWNKGGAVSLDRGSNNVTFSVLSGNTSITSYTNDTDDGAAIYGNRYVYQTTPNMTSSVYLYQIAVRLYRNNNPGNVSINVTLAGGTNPQPIGSTLASVTNNLNSISATSPGVWLTTYNLTTPLLLNNGQSYAFIISDPSGDAANYVVVRQNNAGAYANGMAGSTTDGGVTWTASPAVDLVFYMTAPISVSTAVTGNAEKTVTTNATANYPSWATGSTLSFDALGDSVNCTSGATLNNIFNAGGTLDAWIYPRSDGQGDAGRIFDKDTWWCRAGNEAAGYVKLTFVSLFTGTNGNWSTTAASIPINSITHVAVVYTSNNATTPIIYINGASVAVTVNTVPTGTHYSDVGSGLLIGNNVGSTACFDGLIVEGRVYTTPATAATVLNRYNRNYSDRTGLVGEWYLDEGSGTSSFDYSGNSNTGTITNATWTTSTYTSGNTGRLCDFTLTVGSSRVGTNLKGVTAPNTTNNWIIADNTYWYSWKEWVGGNLKCSLAWNYGATLTDLSGNGNTGTPAFRTTSSSANVSAALASFGPVNIPEAPPFTVGEGPDWLSGNVTMSGNFTTGNVTLKYPFKAVIDGLATATATPSQLPLTFISGFVILTLSIVSSAFMRNFGGASAFVKAVVLFAGFGSCIAVQIYDFWMVFFLGVFVITVLFASKERSST